MLADAELVVFPSDFEGFGLPVVEGMLLGKPVVLGPEPATNEVAGGHAAVAADWTSGGAGRRRTPGAVDDRRRARGRARVGGDVHLGADDPADPRGAGRDERPARAREPATAAAAAAVAAGQAAAPGRDRRCSAWCSGVRRGCRADARCRRGPRAVRGHRGAGPGARHRAPRADRPRSWSARCPSASRPGIAAFEPWLRRTVSARYVLEVRDGLLVGDYAATVAPALLVGGCWTTRPAATSGSRAGASTRCSCARGCPSRDRCRGRCCRWPPEGRARTTTTSLPTSCPAGGSSRRRCPAPTSTRSTWARGRRTSGSCWSWSAWTSCRWSRSTSTPAWRRSGCWSRRRRTRT